MRNSYKSIIIVTVLFIISPMSGYLIDPGPTSASEVSKSITSVSNAEGFSNIVIRPRKVPACTIPRKKQVDLYVPANVEVGDIFTITYTAPKTATTVAVSFTATAATVANVTDGLTTAWENERKTDMTIGHLRAFDQGWAVEIFTTSPDSQSLAPSTTDGGGTNDQTLTEREFTSDWEWFGDHTDWSTLNQLTPSDVSSESDYADYWQTSEDGDPSGGTSEATLFTTDNHATNEYRRAAYTFGATDFSGYDWMEIRFYFPQYRTDGTTENQIDNIYFVLRDGSDRAFAEIYNNKTVNTSRRYGWHTITIPILNMCTNTTFTTFISDKSNLTALTDFRLWVNYDVGDGISGDPLIVDYIRFGMGFSKSYVMLRIDNNDDTTVAQALGQGAYLAHKGLRAHFSLLGANVDAGQNGDVGSGRLTWDDAKTLQNSDHIMINYTRSASYSMASGVTEATYKKSVLWNALRMYEYGVGNYSDVVVPINNVWSTDARTHFDRFSSLYYGNQGTRARGYSMLDPHVIPYVISLAGTGDQSPQIEIGNNTDGSTTMANLILDMKEQFALFSLKWTYDSSINWANFRSNVDALATDVDAENIGVITVEDIMLGNY